VIAVILFVYKLLSPFLSWSIVFLLVDSDPVLERKHKIAVALSS
jgi:hypothetical protein